MYLKIKNLIMKAMSKQEIAAAAGVSIDTLRRWLEPYQSELEQLGYQSKMRVLPPRLVRFICEKLCIDV
mgnify:CR=1 FL=1